MDASTRRQGLGEVWRRMRRRVREPATAPLPAPAQPVDVEARLEALLAARQVQRYEIERWRAAVDRLPEPCLLLNQAGSMLFANRAALQLLQLESGAITGAAFEEMLARRPEALRPSVWREPLADARGSELGALVLLRDPGAEARLDSAIVEFLSHISHELKSPLNTIRSYAEMLNTFTITVWTKHRQSLHESAMVAK